MSEIQKTTVSRAEYSHLITEAIKSMKQAACQEPLPEGEGLVAIHVRMLPKAA